MITTLLLLIAGHYMGDFALQSEYMAFSKDRHHPMGANGHWIHSLAGHSIIHGAIVGLITGSMILGVSEAIVHATTDFTKCEKKISYHVDQAIHIGCKIAWWIICMHWKLP